MKARFKPTKTELLLLLLAALFAAAMFAYKESRTSDEDWYITTDRKGEGTEQLVPVNINTATEEELMTVEGIGPTLAGRIVAYREEHGDFETIEELDNVKGIGLTLIESIRYLVCTEDTQ